MVDLVVVEDAEEVPNSCKFLPKMEGIDDDVYEKSDYFEKEFSKILLRELRRLI